MNPDHDRLFRALASLPQIEPHIEWETRVLARCHAEIIRRASRRARAGRNLSGAGIFDLAATAALSIYLAAVLIETAGLLH